MPHYRAVPVMLSAGERKASKKRARGAKTAHRDWLRAQIVLAAARGRASARIAADLHISVDTVRKWRSRFAARGLDGLKDLPAASGHGGSARWNGPRWSRWPASCPQPRGCRCGAGPPRNWPLNWWPRAWSARSRRRLSCRSWPRTRSSPGSTSHGGGGRAAPAGHQRAGENASQWIHRSSGWRARKRVCCMRVATPGPPQVYPCCPSGTDVGVLRQGYCAPVAVLGLAIRIRWMPAYRGPRTRARPGPAQLRKPGRLRRR